MKQLNADFILNRSNAPSSSLEVEPAALEAGGHLHVGYKNHQCILYSLYSFNILSKKNID